MKFPIFFLIILSSAFSFADFSKSLSQVQNWSAEEKWAEEKQWRKLLHFERNSFGLMRSQVDGRNFFLSADGHKDLKAELDATIEAFFTPLSDEALKNEAAIPACRFPARWSWIQKKLVARGMEDIPKYECPRFQRFFQTLRGPGMSLIFSSYYLNNPSSAFGHTFLRINKAPAQDGKRYELLDYGLNYAANIDTNNALVYAFKGLFGMLSGTFTTSPYYYKVREYSNAESRDLWEYELNVTPETVDRVVEHMWELGPTQINYWYLSENCSYHMFSILEAGDANIDLTSKLKPNVIPSDTVQVAWQAPGLVKSIHFRPSIRTELLTRASDLSSEEIDEVLWIIKNSDVSADFSKRSPESQVHILDTAVDYIDFEYAYDIQIADSPQVQLKNKLLALRSQINVVTAPLKVEMPELEKPHLAHGSVRVGAGYLSSRNSENAYLFSYKYALQDQLDPIQGYPEYAQITFFDWKFSVEESRRSVQVEDFTLFEVVSMSPVSKFQQDLSWRIRIASERVRNENCDHCRWSGASGGAGGTWLLSKEPFTFIYLGARGTAAYYQQDQTQFWFGAGPEARLRIRWTPKIISLFEAWYRLDLQGNERVYFERTASTQFSWKVDQGLRLTYKDYGFDQVGLFQLFYYY